MIVIVLLKYALEPVISRVVAEWTRYFALRGRQIGGFRWIDDERDGLDLRTHAGTASSFFATVGSGRLAMVGIAARA